MKTAISLPDDLFDRVEATAAAAGVTRSALVASALTRYLDELEREDLAYRIDLVIDAHGDPRDNVIVKYSTSFLQADEEW